MGLFLGGFDNVKKLKKSALTLLGASWIDTVKDFLFKMDMKSRMHLVEISIFSLNNVTIRPTKIMNITDKNWAYF